MPIPPELDKIISHVSSLRYETYILITLRLTYSLAQSESTFRPCLVSLVWHNFSQGSRRSQLHGCNFDVPWVWGALSGHRRGGGTSQALRLVGLNDSIVKGRVCIHGAPLVPYLKRIIDPFWPFDFPSLVQIFRSQQVITSYSQVPKGQSSYTTFQYVSFGQGKLMHTKKEQSAKLDGFQLGVWSLAAFDIQAAYAFKGAPPLACLKPFWLVWLNIDGDSWWFIPMAICFGPGLPGGFLPWWFTYLYHLFPKPKRTPKGL